MKHTMELVVGGALISTTILSIAVFSILAISNMQAKADLQSQGFVSAEEGLLIDKSSLYWGSILVGSEGYENLTITNKLPVPVVLSFQTWNWTPALAADYLTLSWDYDNRTLTKDQSILVNLTLSVSPDCKDIYDFSFDLTIYSDEI